MLEPLFLDVYSPEVQALLVGHFMWKASENPKQTIPCFDA